MKSSTPTGYPLEITGVELREILSQIASQLSPFIDSIDSTPVDMSDSATESLLSSVRESLPEEGGPLPDVLRRLLGELMPPSLSPVSGGFMGYVPGGGISLAAVADLISGIMNRYVGAYPVAPALAEVEASVIRWFVDILEMPSETQGFMTSGGSLANQSALTVARTVTCGEQFQNSVIYLSDQAHGCLSKAAKLCGFPASRVTVIPSDSQYRICLSALRKQIKQDIHTGLKPMFVAGNAGTTNSGAIDPLREMAELCQEFALWFHVDAAYGGFFAMTDRGRKRLDGIACADSIALDPHKTLFLPYGTGALLVRKGEWLRQTFQAEADYLPDSMAGSDTMDFRDISPELTRPFRGLRVWLPLKVHGAGVFRACLDEKLDLAEAVEAFVRASPELELLAEPELSILAFAAKQRIGEPLDVVNDRSRKLLARINQENRVHLTGTSLHGRFALRVAIVVYRTHQIHIDRLLEDLQASILKIEENNE